MTPQERLRLAAGHADSGAAPFFSYAALGMPPGSRWESVRWMLPSFGRKGELARAMLAAKRGAELKERGNQAFRTGRVADAARAYREALDVLVDDVPADSPECCALAATVTSNLAACGLQDLDASGLGSKEVVVATCRAAAALDGPACYAPPALRARAYERLARALLWNGGSREEALEAAECAADLAPITPDLDSLLRSLGTPAHRPPNMPQIISACGMCDSEEALAQLRLMLEQGLRPTSKDTSPSAPGLGMIGPIDIICSRLPRIDVRALSLFLDAGADPNSRQLDSITPLMSAAGVFHLEGVRLLLAAGADINAANSDGFTPLMLACRPYSADRLERSLGRRVEREEHEAMVTATFRRPERHHEVTLRPVCPGRAAAALSRNAAACRALLDAGAPPSAITHGIEDPGSGVAAGCALQMAMSEDELRTPGSEAAAVIRERMLAGSDHDRAVAKASDWLRLCKQMVHAYNILCPPEGAGPRTEAEGAADSAAQMQGMAEWMAAQVGVEAPMEAAGNPLLAIHRHMHGIMPRELQTVWGDTMDMTGEEIDILWLHASAISAPPLEPCPGGFIAHFPGYENSLHDPLRGCDVVAYDITPPSRDALDNRFFHSRFSEVLPGGPVKAAEHGDRTLLLVWPWSPDEPTDSEGRTPGAPRGGGSRRRTRTCASCGAGPGPGAALRVCAGCGQAKYCSRRCQRAAWPDHKAACKAATAEAGRPWDVVALEAYPGDVVIYVGEWEGQTLDPRHTFGCSSSGEFQRALRRGFTCVQRVPVPWYRNVRDDLSVWRRRARG
eukprot:jgi/Tetstr1/464342/TSEL_009138.t2